MGKKSKPHHGGKKNSINNKVVGVKKAKTKTVSTNLKKMNLHNKAKTAEIDKQFEDMQTIVVKGKDKKQQTNTKQKPLDRPAADVDAAMDSMETLMMPSVS